LLLMTMGAPEGAPGDDGFPFTGETELDLPWPTMAGGLGLLPFVAVAYEDRTTAGGAPEAAGDEDPVCAVAELLEGCGDVIR
jgi:hypothetical protein